MNSSSSSENDCLVFFTPQLTISRAAMIAGATVRMQSFVTLDTGTVGRLADRWSLGSAANRRRGGLGLPFHLEYPNLLQCTKPVRASVIDREPFHKNASPKNS